MNDEEPRGARLLRELAAVIDGMPDIHFDLCFVHRERWCGTICCAVGAAALHPQLSKATGLSLNSEGILTHNGRVDIFDVTAANAFDLTRSEALGLFMSSGSTRGGDKQVFARRLCRLFDRRGWSVSPEYRAIGDQT